MLGLELEQAIEGAWLKFRGKILSDPQELQRRLARRRSKMLTRPPRAWCIAVRASDRRITPAHWVISPEHAMDLHHPGHPYEPIEHEVTIQTHAIQRYCIPVSFSIAEAVDVARMLGVSNAMLLYARRRGRFFVDYEKGLGGKRGHPVPLISANRQLFDPSQRDFAPPHSVWGSQWEFLSRMFPDGFEQTVIRRPHFGRWGKAHRHADDPPKFLGWRWVCPVCKKEVRRLYYPLPVRTLFDAGWFTDPAVGKKLCDADLVEAPPASFACTWCHGVYHYCSIDRGSWGRVIGYLTGGMLYGKEVKRPESFVPERKRARARRMKGEAPVRRKVLTRLRNGWSYFQIAKDLGISVNGVGMHVLKICREEGVANRHELARKLNFAKAPPLNYAERARARREKVLEMMLGDCTQKEMMAKLGIDQAVLSKDVEAIYKKHGISERRTEGRRKLAEKLGVGFVCQRDEVLKKIKEMREKGVKWKEIGVKLGLSETVIPGYRANLREGAEKSVDSGVG